MVLLDAGVSSTSAVADDLVRGAQQVAVPVGPGGLVSERPPEGRCRGHMLCYALSEVFHCCRVRLPHNMFDQYIRVVGPVRSGFFDMICPVTGFKSQDKMAALFIAALSFLKLRTQKGEVGHFPATAYQKFASQTVHGQAKWCVSCFREGCRSRFA